MVMVILFRGFLVTLLSVSRKWLLWKHNSVKVFHSQVFHNISNYKYGVGWLIDASKTSAAAIKLCIHLWGCNKMLTSCYFAIFLLYADQFEVMFCNQLMQNLPFLSLSGLRTVKIDEPEINPKIDFNNGRHYWEWEWERSCETEVG